jgi:hypothetical protein
MKETPRLGDRVKDEITGFTGIAIGVTDWIATCRRWVVQPEQVDKDGKVIEAHSFDEPHVIVLKRGVVSTANPTPAPRAEVPHIGGPAPEPTRSATPSRRG